MVVVVTVRCTMRCPNQIGHIPNLHKDQTVKPPTRPPSVSLKRLQHTGLCYRNSLGSVSVYDNLGSYQFKPGKGYDKRSVEQFRASALNQIEDLLLELTQLKDQMVDGYERSSTVSGDEAIMLRLFRGLRVDEQQSILVTRLRVPHLSPPTDHDGWPIPEAPAPSQAPPPIVENAWLTELEEPATVEALDAPAEALGDYLMPPDPFASLVTWDETIVGVQVPPTTAPFDPFTTATPAFLPPPPPAVAAEPKPTPGEPASDWFHDHAFGLGEPVPPVVMSSLSASSSATPHEVTAPLFGEVISFPSAALHASEDNRLDSLFNELDFGPPPAAVLASTCPQPVDHLFEPLAQSAPLIVTDAPTNSQPLPTPVAPWSGWIS